MPMRGSRRQLSVFLSDCNNRVYSSLADQDQSDLSATYSFTAARTLGGVVAFVMMRSIVLADSRNVLNFSFAHIEIAKRP
jgi:hypothetical protein